MNLIEATSGTAEILEMDSRRLSPKELAQIGYVSEDQELPAKLSTVAEYLNYIRPFYPDMGQAAGGRDPQAISLSAAGCGAFEICHMACAWKMALTCALSYRPKVLVLDEPCSRT